jgi:hypothetical protein
MYFRSLHHLHLFMKTIIECNVVKGSTKDLNRMKKRRRWKKYDTTTYFIAIMDWEVSYSFRLTGDMKDMH